MDIGLTGFAKIELPSGTIRLCDGGIIKWGAEIFTARDPVFGTIGSIEALEEGVGDEVPALQIVMLPPTTSAAATLCAPGQQQSKAYFWIAEYNTDTNLVIGVPALTFAGFLDQCTLTAGRGERDLSISIVSLLERLFELNSGNSLNSTWHKSIWPGETGHDNATGLGFSGAWGTESPPTAYAASSGTRSWWQGNA